MNLCVTGRSGRMGQAVVAAAAEFPDVAVVATHDHGEDLDQAIARGDAVIDFTLPAFTAEVLAAAQAHQRPLVIGTTGHSPEQLAAVAAAARDLPVVHAPNYSVGVNTLFWLARHATRILGPDFDLEVIEMHHRHKRDAPSGTAVRLAQVIAEARGLAYPAQAVFGRQGETGPRPRDEIAVHTLRGGDVVGDHTALYAAEGERLELTHKASSRATFARGAIRAALWLRDRPSGLYTMEDVLGLAELAGPGDA